MSDPKIEIPAWKTADQMPYNRKKEGPSEEVKCKVCCDVTIKLINAWLARGTGVSRVIDMPSEYQQALKDSGCVTALEDAGFQVIFAGDTLVVAKP